MHKINVKPLSVNQAYQGRRFKTNAARLFFDKVILAWRDLKRATRPNPPKKGNLFTHYRFGVSNMRADCDNPVKPFMDALFFALDTDDRRTRFMIVEKVKTEKGSEFIEFHVESEALLLPYLERLVADMKREAKPAEPVKHPAEPDSQLEMRY